MAKHYWMYIGLDPDKNKNDRFVVETNGLISTTDLTFRGKVVAVGTKSPYQLGKDSRNWCSPIHDIMNGYTPSFIPIHHDLVKEKFPVNTL
jgi:hypothetical protein